MKLVVKLFFVAIGLIFFICLSWAAVDSAIHASSDYEFCLSCHSHKPIGTSYFASLHGGKNNSGWRATCSDCHIDQSNSFTYLWVKGTHGLIDPPTELLTDTFNIDWHEHRKQRESFVFDSGCLGCHKLLQERSEANSKAFVPHRQYFNNNTTGQTCVSCHTSVGHANLGNHLREHGWEDKK
jgi:cytochrome c-type protein NapC